MPASPESEWRGARVVVMGLGRFGGGIGAARYLAQRGADVLVTDRADAESLADSVRALADLPVAYRLGEHRIEDFEAADWVVVTPAIPPRGNPWLEAARARGARLTTEVALGLERLPTRRTVAVTGTVGKSTVTAMIAHAVRAQGVRAHPLGNIGASVLEAIPGIGAGDWVVLELSSFMLAWLDATAFAPRVAVMTPFAPHHLDWHGGVEAYRAAKARVFRGQGPDDAAVLAADAAPHFAPSAPTRVVREPTDAALAVPGAHNRANAGLAAEATAAALGVEPAEALAALADFRGLPHRLERVAERGGVVYVNDAKATTPEAAVRALESLAPAPLRAVVGGAEKGQDLDALARAAAQRCRGIYTVGETGPRIGAQAAAAGAARVRDCGTIERAVRAARADAAPGETVVLTPGCASSDQFPNYEHRGAAFVAAVERDGPR